MKDAVLAIDRGDMYERLKSVFLEEYLDAIKRGRKMAELKYDDALLRWISERPFVTSCEFYGFSGLKLHFKSDEELIMFMLEWK